MAPTTRRQFLQMLLVGSGGALLAACSQPAQPAPPPAPIATQAPLPTAPAPAAKPAATVAATSMPTAAAAQVKNVDFVVVDGTEPNQLDPPKGTGPWGHLVHAMYEGLVQWNEKGSIEPTLATGWEPSPDGKVWTVRLRQGVKFHDGTPFNSQAVKATIEHILDPNTQANRAASFSLIKNIDTPDDYTVKFTTDPPNPDFPFLLADRSAKIISPTALKKYGADFGRNPVGTGSFKFEEWKPNDHVSALLYEDYWGPKPLVRRFVYKVVPEAAARVVVLKTGEADVVVGISPADVASLKQDPNVVVEVTQSPGVMENEPKQSKPPFTDVRVRYALNQSIDKKAIIQGIMGGFARELFSPAMPGTWGGFEFEPFPYDPEKAKQLLAEAGYPNGFDCTLQVVPGRWPGDLQVAEACQGYWARIGLRCTVKKVEMAEMSTYLRGDPDTLPGNLMLRNTISDYTDYHLYRMYHSDATVKTITAQRYAYQNPEVDRLINEEERTFDQEKRLQIMKQAQELIWKDQPLVYLFQQMNIWGHRKNVSGYRYLQNNELVPLQLQKG